MLTSVAFDDITISLGLFDLLPRSSNFTGLAMLNHRPLGLSDNLGKEL